MKNILIFVLIFWSLAVFGQSKRVGDYELTGKKVKIGNKVYPTYRNTRLKKSYARYYLPCNPVTDFGCEMVLIQKRRKTWWPK